MAEQRRVLQETRRQVTSRFAPLVHSQVAGTTQGGADTSYTLNQTCIVRRLSVVNTTSAAVDLTIHSVPSGGTIGTSNTEISQSIPADSSVDLTDLIGGMYEAGTTIESFASTTNVLILHGYIEELL